MGLWLPLSSEGLMRAQGLGIARLHGKQAVGVEGVPTGVTRGLIPECFLHARFRPQQEGRNRKKALTGFPVAQR